MTTRSLLIKATPVLPHYRTQPRILCFYKNVEVIPNCQEASAIFIMLNYLLSHQITSKQPHISSSQTTINSLGPIGSANCKTSYSRQTTQSSCTGVDPPCILQLHNKPIQDYSLGWKHPVQQLARLKAPYARVTTTLYSRAAIILVAQRGDCTAANQS